MGRIDYLLLSAFGTSDEPSSHAAVQGHVRWRTWVTAAHMVTALKNGGRPGEVSTGGLPRHHAFEKRNDWLYGSRSSTI